MTIPHLLQVAMAMSQVYAPGSVPTFENPDRTAHVYVGTVEGIPTILWEGTTDPAEWVEDFCPLESADVACPPIGMVHGPSLRNVLAILPLITAHLDSMGNPPVYVAGHSKGAREAPICHAILKFMGYSVLAGFYFEPPRPGGSMLASYMRDEAVIATQTMNCHGADIVTLVPHGFGWEPVTAMTVLRVPDTFTLADKHRMPGVVLGVQNLLQPQAGSGAAITTAP